MQTQVADVYGNENSSCSKGEDGWRQLEMGTGRVVGCQFPPDNLLGWQVSWYQTVCKQSDGTLNTHTTHTHIYTELEAKNQAEPEFQNRNNRQHSGKP